MGSTSTNDSAHFRCIRTFGTFDFTCHALVTLGLLVRAEVDADYHGASIVFMTVKKREK